MPSVVAQVVQLAVLVLSVLSLLRAAQPQGRTDEPAFRRRRAEALTVFFGLVTAYLTVVVVLRLTGPDGVDPLGIIPFFTLVGTIVAAVVTLLPVWRRALDAARPPMPRATDEEVRRHRGLSGEDVPPTRW